MAIPARHIVRIFAEHPLRARHEIFQDLVQRMADMDIAIGIGRPVMQDEFRLAPPGLGADAGKDRSRASGRAAPAPFSAGRRASENRCGAEKGSWNNREGYRASVSLAAPGVCLSMSVSGLLARATPRRWIYKITSSRPGRRQAKRLWRSGAGGAPNSEQEQIRIVAIERLLATKAPGRKHFGRMSILSWAVSQTGRKVADKPGSAGAER